MSAGPRVRASLALALTAAFGFSSAAIARADFAGDSAIGGPRLSVAVNLAEQHWGATPCSAQFTISWVAADLHVNAVSQWSNPFDSYQQPGLNSDCSIAFNPGAQWDWPKLCTVVVHEVGHLDGQQHNGDPANVMSPVYTRPVAECAATTDPQAPVAAPRSAPRAAVAAVAKKASVASRPRRARAAALTNKHKTSPARKRHSLKRLSTT
jgi:Matrixin